MIAYIYLLTCDRGCKYVGCTTRTLPARLSEIRYQAPKRNTAQSDCFRSGHSCHKMTALEEVVPSEMFEREIFWINCLGKENLLNRANGGRGPTGCTQTDHHREISKRVMQERWSSDRSGMLRRVNTHKTSETQRAAGIIGARAKWSKMKAGGLSQ